MKRNRSQYNISKSPLFRVHSTHVLARCLRLKVNDLADASKFHADYHEGTVQTKGKMRRTETPVRRTRPVHNRLLVLLSRIQVPSYLHSGTKGRSYVTNAAVHLGSEQTYCVDIADFFSSTTWFHVYSCFF